MAIADGSREGDNPPKLGLTWASLLKPESRVCAWDGDGEGDEGDEDDNDDMMEGSEGR